MFVVRAPVGQRVADGPAGAVDGAVGSLAAQFGAPVAVEIKHEEVGCALARAYVHAEVYAPQPPAVELVSVEDGVSGESPLGRTL